MRLTFTIRRFNPETDQRSHQEEYRLDIGRGMTVLEAGTGTGHYLRAILDRFPAAAIGLDISKFALRRAARLNPEAINIVCDV